ncbi:MAG: type IV toxin-antitoxin system AbiEi family antitoxin domain-containing protein [Capsulimonadaceae bacterium]
MSLPSETKINKTLKAWPSGTVGLTIWLEQMGVSRQLLQHYQKTGWIESIGRGAFQRAGDSVEWLGGLYAIQQQAGLDIHVGARTALGMMGQAHYLELNAKVAQLFGPRGVTLPAWFANHGWGIRPELSRTDFLPPQLGMVDVESKLFTVKASGAARALMEFLYLAHETFDLVEASQIMEGLGTLRPATVQQLLEACHSVKVKRLFVYMAERGGHPWLKHLDLTRVDMGRGKRQLAEGGVYVPKYEITIPRELATQ